MYQIQKYEEEKQKEGFTPNAWKEEKIKAFENIGLDLFAKRYETKALEREEWMQMYNLLKDFQKKNGHVSPPKQAGDPLYIWVTKQRHEYNKRISGKPSNITALRIRYLSAINFQFLATKQNIPWDDRYEELKLYKAKYGNVLVPRSYPGKICISNQEIRSLHSLATQSNSLTISFSAVTTIQITGKLGKNTKSRSP